MALTEEQKRKLQEKAAQQVARERERQNAMKQNVETTSVSESISSVPQVVQPAPTQEEIKEYQDFLRYKEMKSQQKDQPLQQEQPVQQVQPTQPIQYVVYQQPPVQQQAPVNEPVSEPKPVQPKGVNRDGLNVKQQVIGWCLFLALLLVIYIVTGHGQDVLNFLGINKKPQETLVPIPTNVVEVKATPEVKTTSKVKTAVNVDQRSSMALSTALPLDNSKLATMMAYNAKLAQGDPHPELVEGMDAIQFGTLLGYLEIPKTKFYGPIKYGMIDDFDDGIYLCLVEGTSFPVGGNGTHACIGGVFRTEEQPTLDCLASVVVGDYFYVHTYGINLAYQVDQVDVVQASELNSLSIYSNEDYITLTTVVTEDAEPIVTEDDYNGCLLMVRGKRVDYRLANNITAEPTVKPTPTPRLTATPKPTATPDMSKNQFKNSCIALDYKSVCRNPERYRGQNFVVTAKVRGVDKGGIFDDYDICYKCYTDTITDNPYLQGTYLEDMFYVYDEQDPNSSDYLKVLDGDVIRIYGTFEEMGSSYNYLNHSTSDEIVLHMKYAELVSE